MSRPRLDFEEVAVDTGVKRRDSGAHDMGRDHMLAFLQSQRSSAAEMVARSRVGESVRTTDGVELRRELVYSH